MVTTIQITEELRDRLASRRMYDKESYEEVIQDLLEDSMELSKETKAEIEQAKRDIANGKVYTLSEAKKELGL